MKITKFYRTSTKQAVVYANVGVAFVCLFAASLSPPKKNFTPSPCVFVCY